MANPNRPFGDLVVSDFVTEEDLLLVSADHVYYGTRVRTIISAILESLGGPGFVIQPNDLGLELDNDTGKLHLTYKGERCENGTLLMPAKK